MSTTGQLVKPQFLQRIEIVAAGRPIGAGVLALLLAGCAAGPLSPESATAKLPRLLGWFEGEEIVYITTDVSDADLAKAKGANYAPRLADALPAAGRPPAQPSSVDKVYAVTNFAQGSVFASAPSPLGHLNRDPAYSPLWQMITVTWSAAQSPRTLKSEEEVLDAAEKGLVKLDATRVVLNCPVLQRASKGSLPGVTVEPASR